MPFGGFNYVHKLVRESPNIKYEYDIPIGADCKCVHKWSPVGTNYYEWEFRFEGFENVGRINEKSS
jgi:hypothetical protein